jgi:hypothetical protein
MGLLQLEAECEIYFKNNWTLTDIQLPNKVFDYDNKTSWIALSFNPTINQRMSSDRILYNGLSSVFCYHEEKKLALKLADDVESFFNCKELPFDIRVDIAQFKPPIDLDIGFWEVKVNFEVTQY